MRRAGAVARSPRRYSFVPKYTDECEVTDPLPLWMRALFEVILRVSDFRTGFGCVPYAFLVAGVTPVQPRRGPRHFVPDVQAIKKAVRLFELRGLLWRDFSRSQGTQLLFFQVRPRVGSVRPKPKLEPQSRTPVDSRKASNGAASRGSHPKTRTPISNPVFSNKEIQNRAREAAVDKSPARPVTRAKMQRIGELIEGMRK